MNGSIGNDVAAGLSRLSWTSTTTWESVVSSFPNCADQMRPLDLRIGMLNALVPARRASGQAQRAVRGACQCGAVRVGSAGPLLRSVFLILELYKVGLRSPRRPLVATQQHVEIRARLFLRGRGGKKRYEPRRCSGSLLCPLRQGSCWPTKPARFPAGAGSGTKIRC